MKPTGSRSLATKKISTETRNRKMWFEVEAYRGESEFCGHAFWDIGAVEEVERRWETYDRS